MTILALVILAAIVAAYVGYPLWRKAPAAERAERAARRTPAAAPPPAVDVEEIELDRAAGRLDADDFEALAKTRPTADDAAPAADGDDIERRVAALRRQRAAAEGKRTGTGAKPAIGKRQERRK